LPQRGCDARVALFVRGRHAAATGDEGVAKYRTATGRRSYPAASFGNRAKISSVGISSADRGPPARASDQNFDGPRQFAAKNVQLLTNPAMPVSGSVVKLCATNGN
jgi:hypothetical protein